jgi:hypothetical protein
MEPTKSAMDQDCRPMAGSGAELIGGVLAAGVGHASTVRPDPSTLGAVENEAPTTRAARRPVPGKQYMPAQGSSLGAPPTHRPS